MSTTDATTKPAPPTTDRAPTTDEPLTRRRRIRAWATVALRDLVYAAAVFVWSIAAFTILVTGVSLTASLIVFIAGVFVWVGFVYVVRWTTWVDRRLAGWQRHERLTAAYRRPPAGGFLPLLKTVSADPQTWRDLGWLGLTSIVGFTLGLVAITAMGVVVAYLSMPIWYWAISDPEGQFGLTNLGLFSVDTLGEAVAVAAIGLALAPLALLLARGCATAHAAVAARILRPSPRKSRRSAQGVRAMSPPSATTQSMCAPAGPDQAVGRHDNLTARAARWSAAHRKAAVLGWLAFVLVTFAIGSAAGFVFMKDEEFGIGDSHGAEKVLAREFPTERAAEQVLIQSRGGRLNRAQLSAAVDDLVMRLSRVRAAAAIESPLDADNAGQVSPDGRSALVRVQIKGDPDTAQDRVDPALAATAAVQRAHPELLIGEVGHGSINKAMSERLAEDFQRAEVTSLPVTLVILVLAFGALVAAGIPLLLGLTAVMGALGLTALFSHLLHVEESINSVILLIGLAVGIDYSLFYLRRYREERAQGRSPAAALEMTAATSGRAVLVSGLTVMTAMSGMFLMGTRVFQGFGMGTILVVAIALVGSLTVLPAIISKLGDRIDRGRIPLLSRLVAREGESRFWARIVGGVLRRPLVYGVLAATLLAALAIPAFRLHTAEAGAQGLPPDLPILNVYNRAQEAFPGGPLPAIVAVRAPDVTAPEVSAGIDALKRAALATGQMQEPISVDISASRRAARVLIPLAGDGTDEASNRALDALRGSVIPSTIERVDGAEAHVTGATAGSRDFNDSMKAHAPYVFAFVLGMAFVLLLVTFRSIVIPIKAIVLNLLSVAASYGVLVLVFQDGRFESLLDFQSFGAVTPWLPLFLFVVLFGLSMDYHVLILSRVREAHDAGMPTAHAVDHGIRATASVVTSAAIVMVGVFAIFATLGWIDFKMMGVGLAVAVFLDATIVRAVLLPATMALLGDWNWYLPRWLQWLPRISHEPPATPTDTKHETRIPVGA